MSNRMTRREALTQIGRAGAGVALAGGVIRGQAADIAIQAEQLVYTKKRMAELTAQHTGQTIEKVEADAERDRWFTAEEAVDYGLVDKVILRRGEIL